MMVLDKENLINADLRYANLRNAYLCYANLCNANLCNADLRDADLRDANLCNADLCNADLCNADLRYANLRYANLRNADLRGTILDPLCVPSGAADDWERIINRNGTQWVIGWRSKVSKYVGCTEYIVGEIYESPVFSVAQTLCHPGLYLCKSKGEVLEHYSSNVVMVMTPAWEVHEVTVDDETKCRTRWFVVVKEELMEE